jgi:hypothetical protein
MPFFVLITTYAYDFKKKGDCKYLTAREKRGGCGRNARKGRQGLAMVAQRFLLRCNDVKGAGGGAGRFGSDGFQHRGREFTTCAYFPFCLMNHPISPIPIPRIISKTEGFEPRDRFGKMPSIMNSPPKMISSRPMMAGLFSLLIHGHHNYQIANYRRCPIFSRFAFKYRSLCGLGFTRIGTCSTIFNP